MIMIPISVCIITKNEAHHLENCLKSIKPYPFEIVVVDTGSTDNSKEVAQKYTDKVYDFEWIDNFSAARNFSISKASHNMILVLDTDEMIIDLNLDEVERLIEENPKAVGLVKRIDYFEINGLKRSQEVWIDRLFNRKYYEYDNPVHECVYPIGKMEPSSYHIPIVLDHVGYIWSQEALNEKALRDIRLLEKQLEIEKDNPYIYFQIAQSYLVMRQEDKAFPYYEEAMRHNPDTKFEYTRVLVKNYGEMLLTYDRAQEALSLLSYYDALENNSDYLCMVGNIYMQLNQPLRALPEYIKALTAPIYDSPDTRKEFPSYQIGYIYECFGQPDIARSHYEKCGDFPPALERLAQLGQS
jgi:glycosyltransferase involved in cell wall biosynthesis